MTRWAITLRNRDQEFHLGYSARKTKGALLRAMQANSEFVLRTSGLSAAPEEDGFVWNAKSESWQFNGWSIRFSGATEHDHTMMKLLADKAGSHAFASALPSELAGN
jgi:hypothetical protein